jgi:hypothetical protein
MLGRIAPSTKALGVDNARSDTDQSPPAIRSAETDTGGEIWARQLRPGETVVEAHSVMKGRLTAWSG